MGDEESYEDNEMFASYQKDHSNKMSREIGKKFREAAYKGYDLLEVSGKDAVDPNNIEEAILAIRRILGLMVIEEEYEKCQFLKEFLIKKLDAKNPEPIFDFEKNLRP